jgi:UDP-N-acetylmuramoylalanine--D-glutamate ligase
LTPDHLDRYDHADHYYRTKNLIFSLLKPDGYAVINQKDPNSLKFLHPTQTRIGFNVPLQISMPRVVGSHNAENAAAAFAATRALGFAQQDIERALRGFEGMPHRLELLGAIDGVRWFNDSKATNVESAVTAIKSFERGVRLILGGLGKGASYEPLLEACKGRVKCVYLIGEDAPVIEKMLEGNLPIINAGVLETAVKEAIKNTSSGDVILLSPACASFDQYPNYAARGDHLKKLFQEYKGKHHA